MKPKKYTEGTSTITFILDEELKQKFRIYCVTKGITITDFLTNIVKSVCNCEVSNEH